MEVDGKEISMTWWEMRPLMLFVPPPSYAAIKSYIVKTCKQQKCDEAIGSWDRRVKRIDQKLEEKKP